MKKDEKVDIVAEVKDLIDNSNAVYLTDYSGVTVSEINDIRNEFRKEGIKYKVFKNTLFKRALTNSGKYSKLSDHLIGMTGYAFATAENPVAPAKVIKKYFDSIKKLSLKACYIDDQYYDGSSLNELASLPSKKEIVAGIIGSVNAPASGIVGAINAVMRDLVSVIDEISRREAA
jgi:large subunit ribosomal protein L10